MLLLVSILFIHGVLSSDLEPSTNPSVTIEVTDQQNSTEPPGNRTVDMGRIIQEVSLARSFEVNQNNSLNATAKGDFSQSPFRPSPPLGPYYEYNKTPVQPALAEAKTLGLGSYTVPEKPNAAPWDKTAWHAQQPWSSPVKFPNERPYSFITGQDNLNHNFPVTTEGFAFNKPVGLPQKLPYNYLPDSYLKAKPKTMFDYNFLEKPPHYGDEGVYSHYEAPSYEISQPHKEYGYSGPGMEHGSYGVGHRQQMSPWKKIIKFLAVIIPIGLFLSAISPTVITIQNANDTTRPSNTYKNRYRTQEGTEDIAKRLASSFNYFNKLNEDGCEDKVLCELLISASFSKNAEQHVQALLDNFIQQEDLKNKRDDLLKVFESVKNQDCSPILCGNFKNPAD